MINEIKNIFTQLKSDLSEVYNDEIKKSRAQRVKFTGKKVELSKTPLNKDKTRLWVALYWFGGYVSTLINKKID